MLLHDATQQYQSALATYCRTGKYVSIPGVKEKHVGHYRRLVYNVVEDTLQSAYPLTYEMLSTREWRALVTQFFAQHACVSAQVWYMPKELYEFVLETKHPLTVKYPFLSELLWLEWLEVELYMMEDRPSDFQEKGDLLKSKLVLNQEFHLQYFTFPVHVKKAKSITLADKGNYFLVLHRHPETGSVSFTDLSPAFVRMLEVLGEEAMSLEEVLQKTCEELQVPISSEIMNATVAFFERSLENKLILGFK
jgi:hypothetical protein